LSRAISASTGFRIIDSGLAELDKIILSGGYFGHHTQTVEFKYRVARSQFIGTQLDDLNGGPTGSPPQASFSLIGAAGFGIGLAVLVTFFILIGVVWHRQAKRNDPIKIEDKQ
jgi:hypothetical protein